MIGGKIEGWETKQKDEECMKRSTTEWCTGFKARYLKLFSKKKKNPQADLRIFIEA